jgi:hypothetical protein
MKVIEFTNKKGKIFEVLIDDEDYEILLQNGWYCTKAGNTYYLRNDSFFIKRTYFHRLILNCPKNKVIDHINGNGLDNRKENLRICDKQQNHFNSQKGSGYTSKYLGVSWDKAKNLWRASIMVNRKTLYLGRFKSEELAASAYNEASKKYFKEFGKLNIL